MGNMSEETSLDLLLLFAGSCGLLVLATLGGELLRAKLGQAGNSATVETYMTRLHSWWAMVILLSLALMSGRLGVVLLFAFASFAALREFLTLTRKTKADHWALIAAFYVVFPLQYVLVWLGEVELFTRFIPVYAFLILPILAVIRGPATRFLSRVAQTQWALMICVYCASHVPALLLLDTGDTGDRAVLLIAFLVLVVQLADLAEYFIGKRIGKTKVAPDISPKTREGIAAAALFAAALGALLSWITPFGILGAAAIAALIYLVGVGGNLVLAAIKADRGVKNWGHLIPGQGGFVDQLDSVIFAAPVFFHLARYFYVS